MVRCLLLSLAVFASVVALACTKGVLQEGCGPHPSQGVGVGKTYYVDFESGSDGNDGTTSANAFKHAPGDSRATGRVPSKLLPGAVVRFKGGVVYRGTVSVPSNGTVDAPIVYKGNGWGAGRAVIDGSDRITGWKPCTSRAQCGGNSNWRKMFFASTRAVVRAVDSNLYQGEKMLYLAQHPDPSDRFYMDELRSYLRVPIAQTTQTTITDARLAALGGPQLVGSYVGVWVSGASAQNRVDFQRISSYDEASTRIGFDALREPPRADGSHALYTIINSSHSEVLNVPGEYFFDDYSGQVFLWPLDASQIEGTTISTRATLFEVHGRSHVTLEGFRLQKASGGYGQANAVVGASCAGVVVQDNEITASRTSSWINSECIKLSRCRDSVVQDNYIHDNPRLRGVGIYHSKNSSILRNTVKRNGGSALIFRHETNGLMVGNTVTNSRGVHANSLTAYDCTRVKMAGNRVIASGTVAVQASSQVEIVNNIVDAQGGTASVLASWGDMIGANLIANNIIIGSSTHCAVFLLGVNHFTYKNNIVDGTKLWPQDGSSRAFSGSIDHSHNAYVGVCTDLSWADEIPRDGDGEITDTEFPNYFVGGADYRSRAASPARDTGTDLSAHGVAADMGGKPRPVGDGWDMGPYED